MPKPGDFLYQDKLVKCYVTGWGRRTESKFLTHIIDAIFTGFTFLCSIDGSYLIRTLCIQQTFGVESLLRFRKTNISLIELLK